MNNQFATQYLLEKYEDKEGAIEEMSTTGGGTTTGATFTPGAGEQVATTKAFKKKYKEGLEEEEEPADYYELVGEDNDENLSESRAYSQFKKQTATRSKNEQMHEAVKMIHKRLEEVSKLVEFAQKMRTELSEGDQALEYRSNTKKVFEKINAKVVEVYTKTRELK